MPPPEVSVISGAGQRPHLNAVVSLYKALGGGWDGDTNALSKK